MPKPSNREKLLTKGLRVVHEKGFVGASVRDIVHAAGVPQGSFTNHFVSKEAFCLEILEIYFARTQKMIQETLLNDALPPLQRLRAYIEGNEAKVSNTGVRCGCLYGNFAAEASDHSEVIRRRLMDMFTELKNAIAACLKAAVKAGEAPKTLDCEETASFVFASLQGAILLAKGERNLAPITRFKEMLFSKVLR